MFFGSTLRAYPAIKPENLADSQAPRGDISTFDTVCVIDEHTDPCWTLPDLEFQLQIARYTATIVP